MRVDAPSVALGYMLSESLRESKVERLATPEEVAAIFGAAMKGSLQVALAFALGMLVLILPFAIALAILSAILGA